MKFHHPIIDGFLPYKPPPWQPPPWNILNYRHSRLPLTIAILFAITNTTTIKTISTLDVYPLRIFLSDKHFYPIHFTTTPLPSTYTTLTTLTTTSTRGNTFSYPPNFAFTTLTLLTNATKIITLPSTAPAIDIRDDIIHISTSPPITLLASISTRGNTFHYTFKFSVTNPLSVTTKTNITTPTSIPPANNNRGDIIHSSPQLAFPTNSISYSTIPSTNTLPSTATIWNNLLYNTTEFTQFFNYINPTPTDNIWDTHIDNYYLNDHSTITTTNISNATHQISSCHAAHLLSPTITYLPQQFWPPKLPNFPTILTFRNAFDHKILHTNPSRQTFFYQTFHTKIQQNFLVSSRILLPNLRNSFSTPNFSNLHPTDINENCFARAFGGDGGTCECRGGCPPGPPSVGDVMGHSPFLCFLTESFLAN